MSRSDRVLGALVVALALAWGWPTLSAGYEGAYDEGNTLSSAWRVATGELPYRDFWLMHAPGTTWALAAAFRFFGTTVAVERAAKVAVSAAIAGLVFLLARRASRRWAAAAAAVVCIAVPTHTLSLRPRDMGLLLVLATLAAARTGALPETLPRRAFAVGVLAGLTAWFKQDFGVAAAASGAASLFVEDLRGETWKEWKEALPGTARRVLAPCAAGGLAAVLVLFAILAANGTLVEFFRQAIVFPAQSFARVRAVPIAGAARYFLAAVAGRESFPFLMKAGTTPLLFLATVTAGLAAVVSGGFAARRGEDLRAAAGSIAAGIGSLLLLNAPRVRADREHLNPALTLSLVALALLLAPERPSGRRRARIVAAGFAAAIVVFVSLAALRWQPPGAGEGPGQETGLPSAVRWNGIPQDVLDTARFLSSSTSPGERVFVGNDRHDALLCNAPFLYFLAGRKGATPYDNLHPGVVTTRPVQEEIVRRLEEARTRWVVLWDGPPLTEKNDSAVSSGVFVLDEYLARSFRPAARFGEFRVCERISSPR